MNSRSYSHKEVVIAKLEEFQFKIKTASSNCNKLTTTHKAAKDYDDMVLRASQNIPELGKAITRLATLENDICEFNAIIFLDTTLDPKINKYAQYTLEEYMMMLNLIKFTLNQTLIDKCIYTLQIRSIRNKEQYIKQAYDAGQIILRLFGLGIHPDENVQELKGLISMTNDFYRECFTEKDSEINQMLLHARTAVDNEESYTIFQNVITILKQNNNLIRLFNVTWEQGWSYANRLDPKDFLNLQTIETINSRYEYIKKICTSYVAAVNIKLKMGANQITARVTKHCTNIREEMLAFAAMLVGYSKLPCLLQENNFDKRMNLLEDAMQYKIAGLLISNNMNLSQDQFLKLDKEIGIEIEKIKLEKEQTKQLREKEAEYLQTIDTTIKNFPEKKNKKKRKKKAIKKRKIQNNNHPRNTGAANLDHDQPVLTESITPPRHYFHIDIDEQKKLLEIAKEDGNIIQQIYYNTNLSDAYRIKFRRNFLKKNLDYENDIKIFQEAMKYIKKAKALTDSLEMNSIKASQIIELKENIAITLKDLCDLLNQYITYQEKIRVTQEYNRDLAKNDIIQKCGYYAWYKNINFELSPAAINLIHCQQQINELKNLQNDLQKVFGDFTAQINIDIEKKSFERNYNKFTHLTTNAFFKPTPSRELKRSLSLKSFSEPIEEENRRIIKYSRIKCIT